jgi:UDPglucose 6-dehydrogenase
MEGLEMKIAVFGLGFVGLTTAVGLADKGFSVKGYDVNEKRIGEISQGKIPFFEPELDKALLRNLNKTFAVASSATDAVKGCDVCFFCVGTPASENGGVDLEHLFLAIDSVANSLPKNCLIVIKSTVPPSTTAKRILPYVRAKGLANPVAVNPEFLREGVCWDDFMYPDRIVLGVECDSAKSVLTKLYSPFNAPLHFVLLSTAEFIKYLSNSLLANLISYSNEMALLAHALGDIEIAKAFKILHGDKRLLGAGINTYIYPGCGYGGYCLPKDTEALLAVAKSQGVEMPILGSGIALNNQMPALTAQKIASAAGDVCQNVGILGLSFKAETDDVRDSSAAKIIRALLGWGYNKIYVHDPIAMNEFKNAYGLNVTYCNTAEEVCKTCKTVAVVTAWKEYKNIDKLFAENNFVDCRYYLDKV